MSIISDFNEYILRKRAEKTVNPDEDLISVLAKERPSSLDLTGVGFEELSDGESTSVMQMLLVAGNETTSAGLTSAMLTLARDPDLFAHANADSNLIRTVVEEVLRLEPPIQRLFANCDRGHGEINLTGTWYCVRAELRHLAAQNWRNRQYRISRRVASLPGRSAYVTSKHAIIRLTKSAAVEYAASGIRSNAVCPGGVHTPLLEAGCVPCPLTSGRKHCNVIHYFIR